jgi:competence protein CoiA
MQYAIINGVRSEPVKGSLGHCISCGKEVIAKCGKIKIHHWSHKSLRECDSWWEPETSWHREWKNKFPEEFREISFTDNVSGESHRADIHTKSGVTIEFQNSPISTQELQSRENFYSQLVWVVNAEKFRLQFTRNIPDPNNPLLVDYDFDGMCYFKKDEIAKGTFDEDRVFGLNTPELKGVELSHIHRAFEWKNRHEVWLNTKAPTFLDLDDEFLYWLREREQGRCRFWYIQIVSKQYFISKYSKN